MYVQIYDTHICTHILSKYRARKSFMTRSFLFNIQNKSFMTDSFLFYNKVMFYNVCCIVPSC